MTRKLLRYYIILIIATFAIFSGGVTWIISNSALTVAKHDALNYLNIVKEQFVQNNYETQSTLDSFQEQASYLRITFIDSLGQVIDDSHSTTTENHLTRPEIQTPNTVYKRYSSTLQTQMLYVATFMEDSDVYIRIAVPVTRIASNTTYYVIIILLFAITLVILSYFIFRRFIQNSSQALKKISYSLTQITEGNYHEVESSSGYNEIDVIIDRINQINQNISHTLVTLSDEKDKINYILNSINQGIVAVDRHQRILLFNNYIKKIFKTDRIEVNQNFLLLIRKIELQRTIIDCLEQNISNVMEIMLDDSFYRIQITPLLANSTTEGGVLILMNNIDDVIKSDRMKKEFFANASHELKSPLTSIIAASELIANQVVKDPIEIQDLSSRINEEALRMKTLVLQMLSISRLENMKMSDNLSEVNLRNLFITLLESYDLQIKSKQIKTHLKVSNITLYANYEDIYQMISNLFENAIRYGIENGNVWLEAYQDNNHTIISVKDDGIGIDKMHHERIFERFYRVDRGRNRDSGSTGLGLSIVKHVALMYGAKIHLQSELGKGTEIQIIFPNKK